MSRFYFRALALSLAVLLTANVALAQRGRGGGGNQGGGNQGGGNRGNSGNAGNQINRQNFNNPSGNVSNRQFNNPGGNVSNRQFNNPSGNVYRGNVGNDFQGRNFPGGAFPGGSIQNQRVPTYTPPRVDSPAAVNRGSFNSNSNYSVQRPQIPSVNRAPSTTLRNDLNAILGGANSANRAAAGIGLNQQPGLRNNVGVGAQSQITRSSPQHPQHWNNWGNNWSQAGVRPAYRNWGYQGAWSGFYGPRWYSGYGPQSFAYGNRYGLGSGYGSGIGLGYGGLGLGYSGYGLGGYGYGSGLFGLGGLGYGLNPWLLNSAAYRWGYNGFTNPYVGNLGGFPYNYAQPVYVTSYADQSSDDSNLTSALAAARAAFRAGDYERALTWIENVIKASPSDTPAHEFRALTLFALGRYDESAATLNALLAAAPGWNWATMAGFYPDVNVYTQQLRALEAVAKDQPRSPAPQFLLGYHYLVTGHFNAAQKHLETLVALEPRDQVARQLLQGLSADDAANPDKLPPPPPDAIARAREPEADRRPAADVETHLEGQFTAKREDGQEFRLTLNKSGDFAWHSTGETARDIIGRFDLEGNVIVLSGGRGDTLAATVTAEGPDQFHFKLLGGTPDDPGLTFRRDDRK